MLPSGPALHCTRPFLRALSPALSATLEVNAARSGPPRTGEGAEGLKAGRAGPRLAAVAVSPQSGVEGPGPEGGGAVRPRTREVARLTERVKGR